MLKEGLLKENIDGEAIFAFNRLKKKKKENLMVLWMVHPWMIQPLSKFR